MLPEGAPNNPDRLLAEAFTSGGVMERLAQRVVEGGPELSPADVANVILPQRGGSPRWELIENAPAVLKTAVVDGRDEVLLLAAQLGMRTNSPDELCPGGLGRIDADQAIWVVEPGANRTSVVRRAVALQAMAAMYENRQAPPLFQIASSRLIPQTVTRGEQVIGNPEHKIAMGLAPEHLGGKKAFTEFDVSLATALHDGYKWAGEQRGGVANHIVRLRKEGAPDIILLQPHETGATDKTGLERGFSTIAGAFSQAGISLEGRQFIIASNGQYRPKDEAQAERWADNHEISMQPPVGIGDEAGFITHYAGQEIVTDDRAVAVMPYVQEAVALQRVRAEMRPK